MKEPYFDTQIELIKHYFEEGITRYDMKEDYTAFTKGDGVIHIIPEEYRVIDFANMWAIQSDNVLPKDIREIDYIISVDKHFLKKMVRDGLIDIDIKTLDEFPDNSKFKISTEVKNAPVCVWWNDELVGYIIPSYTC